MACNCDILVKGGGELSRACFILAFSSYLLREDDDAKTLVILRARSAVAELDDLNPWIFLFSLAICTRIPRPSKVISLLKHPDLPLYLTSLQVAAKVTATCEHIKHNITTHWQDGNKTQDKNKDRLGKKTNKQYSPLNDLRKTILYPFLHTKNEPSDKPFQRNGPTATRSLLS